MGQSEKTFGLFSYGTLQQPEVQQATFGRLLEGEPDVLQGYTLGLIAIRDAGIVATSGLTHHLNIVPSGRVEDEVPGMVLQVTEAELVAADAYEDPSDYRRIKVTLKSGREVFVYIGGEARP
jgi:hypothetical protein